ncbi:MAG: PAS domain S-box protein [Acidobacteriaceae bacterium]|nr:PAS domain S-box protein [Acidobacteriaceae bacterium]
MPVAMLLLDAEGMVIYANSDASKLFGYDAAELAGVSLDTLSFPKRGAGKRARHPWLQSAFEGPLHSRAAEDDRRLRALHRDGHVFPVEIGLTARLEEGAPAFVLTLLDLSARKAVESRLLNLTLELGERTTALEDRSRALQAEVERRAEAEGKLERSREDFRYLFQRNPLPMYLYSPATLRFLEVNDACVKRYGFSREEFLAMSIMGIHPPKQQERFLGMMDELRHEEFATLQNWTQCDREGNVMEVDTFSRSLGASVDSARLVAVVDVTARNAVEAQLRQSQKMEAIGQLTGGVAHDFNNLLTIVLSNLELIAEHSADRPEVRSMVADALASVKRGAGLTQRLLAFARQQPLEPRLVDTAHMVVDMAGLFSRSLGENIVVEHYLTPDLWAICVDSSQLENALLNLAVNARDAMPSGGRLTIEAQNIVLDEEYVRQNSEVIAGEYVQIAVSDSGTGMKRNVLDHILEPFFTTKPVGRGTGLGLSMVYGFIKQSGGHLKIYSEFGLGTTVKLFLPRDKGNAKPMESVAPRVSESTEGAGETILLVEDDATIRKLVERLLGMLGYKVVSAGDGASALKTLAEAQHVDLLLTDVVLPGGMSGAALATEAQHRSPLLRVLYMSGYTRNALLHNSVAEDAVSVLSKPFRKDELARAVYRALHG